MPLLPQQRFGIGQALMQGGQQMPQTGWGALASGLMQGLGGFVQGQGLAQQNAARQQLMQALMGSDQPGVAPGAGGDNREMLLRTLTQNPDLVPEFAAMKTALAGPKGAEESFDLKTVIDPSDGKPKLVQYGNRGTIRPVEGYAPTPSKESAPIVKDFIQGDRVVQKQYDPATGQWNVVGEGSRWNPAGPASTSVRVDNYFPGDAKIPPEQRNKFSDQRAILEQTRGSFDALTKYNPDRAEATKNMAGFLSPEAATADAAAASLEFNMAKLYDQGALQAPDKATVQRMLGDIRDPRISAEARAAKYRELGRMLDRIEKANFGRIESTPPEKAPVVQASPSITPADQQTPVKSRMPTVGTVDGGYRFKGGDPSRKENWEAVR